MSEDPPGTTRRTLAGGSDDVLIREEPLLIEVDGHPVLTMRTPGNDEDLALGFLLSEGVLAAANEVVATRFVAGDAAQRRADAIHVTTRAPRERVRGRLTRTHEIRPSCGVCGLDDVTALLEELPPLLPGVPRVTRAQLAALHADMRARQRAFPATGGCHAAAVCAADGSVLGFAEDVGRHNALDKALGAAARAGADLGRAIALLSGRAGYELVIKCLRLRVPVVASVSAATALSVDLAQAAGATLVGFVRDGDVKVYVDGGRLA